MSTKLIGEMSNSVFSKMGAPQKVSVIEFREIFEKEFKDRKLGKDRARYRYLFGQVIQKVRLFAKHPPKPLPSLQQITHPHQSIDFKKLAANDRD